MVQHVGICQKFIFFTTVFFRINRGSLVIDKRKWLGDWPVGIGRDTVHDLTVTIHGDCLANYNWGAKRTAKFTNLHAERSRRFHNAHLQSSADPERNSSDGQCTITSRSTVSNAGKVVK